MTRKAKAKGADQAPTAAAETAVEAPAAAEAQASPPPGERQPDFIWGGQPVFQCRFCGERYQRINDLAAVLNHEKTDHPTNSRVSEVLGPDGRPLIVAG